MCSQLTVFLYHQGDIEKAHGEVVFLRIENNMLRSISPAARQVFLPPSQPPRLDHYQLQHIIGAADIDHNDVDVDFIIGKTEDFAPRERAQAEQIISTKQFQDWIASPLSAKLLVHWDSHPPRQISHISPLSVFCASFVRILRRKSEQFITVSWFCGRHTDRSETSSVGGSYMVASLIDQLLQQHSFDTLPSPFEAGLLRMDLLRHRDVSELVKLLQWLVIHLPQTITLMFIIDGVVLYERPEVAALPVLASLVRLQSETLPAAIKVLFTSTPGTHDVRGAFEEEDLILNVEMLARTGWYPSEERVARELGGMMENWSLQ